MFDLYVDLDLDSHTKLCCLSISTDDLEIRKRIENIRKEEMGNKNNSKISKYSLKDVCLKCPNFQQTKTLSCNILVTS